MATTISGTCGGFTNGFDGKGYELLAQALNAANRAAKHFKGRSIGRTAYAAKDLLLSVLIEEDAPEVNPKWQRQPDGPGRRGDCSPRLPQIRTCAINAYGSSSHGFAAGRQTE